MYVYVQRCENPSDSQGDRLRLSKRESLQNDVAEWRQVMRAPLVPRSEADPLGTQPRGRPKRSWDASSGRL